MSAEALSEIERHNAEARAEVRAELDKFGKDGRGYETRPGRTPKETLEENIMVILDQGKQAAGDVAKEELNHPGNSNAAVGMAISGARGSMDNLTMMAGSIGQAKVRGARLERGYHQRVLPHFKRGGLGATEKDSFPPRSSVVLSQQSSSCYQFLEENHWSIQRFVQVSPDTCREDSSTLWMTSRYSMTKTYL